ncbi:alpha/beta hydrolase [Microbulbifer yueqingensis]|nr:alpha/beta hydrolase-fold protein [Microbulbifer yueqingensis]
MKITIALLAFACATFCSAADLSYAESRVVHSEILAADKEIYIHVPESTGYPGRKYPVLYLLHGQWDMLPAVATLDLVAKTVPELMIVGIASDGPELGIESSGDSAFAKFLVEELFTLIENQYPAANYRILSGHSHSGRYVMHQWLTGSLPVNRYFAFSPSLEDGAILSGVESRKAEQLARRKPLVLTMASEGEHMLGPYKKIDAVLEPAMPGRYQAQHFPEETHRSTKHTSLKFALHATFPDWAPSRKVKMAGAEGLRQHFETLSARYGFTALPNVEMLQQVTALYSVSSSKERHAKLTPMFTYALRDLAIAPSKFIEIVDYLDENNYPEASRRYLAALCKVEAGIDSCGAVAPRER